MTECEEVGYGIKDSIPKALIMQRLNINLKSALKSIQSFGSEEIAVKQ